MPPISPAEHDQLAGLLDGGPQLKVLQFIHIAVLILTVSLAGVTVAVSLGTTGEATAQGRALVLHMSRLHAVVFTGCGLLAKVLFDARMRGFAARPDLRQSLQDYLARLLVASILRLAPLQAAAFFGLVVCVVAQLEGAVQAEPALWLNAGSAAVLVATVAVVFPLRERELRRFLVRVGRAGDPVRRS